MKPTTKQLNRVFVPDEESKEERCRRILAGVPKVKRASSLRFNYERATQLASQCVRPSELMDSTPSTPDSLGGG